MKLKYLMRLQRLGLRQALPRELVVMLMALKLVEEVNQALPLTVNEVKTYLRLDGEDLDDLIESLILSAKEWCETFQGRRYGTQTWDLVLDQFPASVIKLPKAPLQSVTFIRYTEANGTTTTIDPSTYFVDTDSDPGRIAFYSIPSVQLQPINGVRIRFVAGSPKVPELFKQAMYIYIAHRFDHPDSEDVPTVVQLLLNPDRVIPL